MKKPFFGKGLTLLLIDLSVTNPFAFHIFLPSLPGLSETMGASAATAQLTVSIYMATFAFAQLGAVCLFLFVWVSWRTTPCGHP